MKLEEPVRKRIIRNALLSLFIYALPIVLMIATFYFTGQRPWVKNQNIKKVDQSTVNHKN